MLVGTVVGEEIADLRRPGDDANEIKIRTA
jgi:hypothetical protein